MAEKQLGLSLQKKYAKVGQALLLVLLVTETSANPRLKIYRELNTLLLDISVSISLRATVACPQRIVDTPVLDSELSGVAWLERSLEPSNHVPRVSQAAKIMQTWQYVCFRDWMNYLTLDTLNITGRALSFSPYAQLVEWNEFLKSPQVHCQPLPTRAVYPALWSIYNQSVHYCNDLFADA
jgi:hypothetical protein